jgi:hypothetical protein
VHSLADHGSAAAGAALLSLLLLFLHVWLPCRVLQRKLSHLRRKLWKEAGPPPDLATRLFSERIIYLVGLLQHLQPSACRQQC